MSLKLFTMCVLLYRRYNISKLLPFRHLFGEQALRAIGIILHTEVLINLEQTLLVCDSFKEFFPARVVSEQARCPRFEAAV